MSSEDLNVNEAFEHSDEGSHHRERVRVRKRIRVKKKKSPKRKVGKLIERFIWTIIIISFILTLFYLVKELDLTDSRFKKKKAGFNDSLRQSDMIYRQTQS
jgi:hypothetical protein